MLLDEFCIKVYFWPFLSYLASIKGLCPLYPTGYLPVYPLPPPNGPLTPPQPPFSPLPPPVPPPPPPPPPVGPPIGPPVPPPVLTSLPPQPPYSPPSSTSIVIPTFQPTPPFPQTSVTPPLTSITPPFTPPTTITTTTSSTSSTTTTIGTTLPLPTCPSQPLVCLAGGMRPLPNCACIDPRQQNSRLILASTGQIGSDMMIFMPLNNPGPQRSRRRRRRRRRTQGQFSTPSTCHDARNHLGNCLPLTACPQLVEEYQSQSQNQQLIVSSSSGGSHEFQKFLGQSICGYDGSTFLICCALDHSISNRSPKDLMIPTTSSSNSFHFSPLGPITTMGPQVQVFQPTPPFNQGQRVNPTPNPIPTITCGISLATTNRVVGGQEARRSAYPWIAALGYYDDTNRSALKFLCAGSLINNRYVLTSAHCINPMLALVRLGAHDLSRPSEQGAFDFHIKRTIIHDQFDLNSIANDIALIELNGMAIFSANIGAICLPEGNRYLQEDFVGMNPFVAGWGAAKHQGPTSNVLRDAQVPIVSRQVCEMNYKTVFQFVQFSDKLICAGSSSVDACQGDSGGPLMMPQLEGNLYRFYLLGIVSFGYECARPNFPGVYTRVASYIPWIKKHIS